ncbi:MAG: sulfatase [Opitutaceae bacterium]
MIPRRINPRLVLLAPLLLTQLPKAAHGSETAPARPPNILFIIADQWRAQAFGFAGDPNVRTPHFDALARQSVNCVNALSSLPVCGPTRASLLTGQRALTHGVFLNDVSLNPAAVTLAKVLDRAGYATGYIGKWHVDGHGRSAYIPRDRRQGFEYWKALECTHSYNDSYYYADGPEKLEWKGYDALAQTRDAEQYLRDRAKIAKPFFLVLSWGPPHSPYQSAPESYRKMYRDAEIRLRPNVPAAGAAKARTEAAGYYAHCTALDDCLAELRQTLQATGLADNTIVVFTSDHGDLLGSHGAYDKQQPYDESIRVPLLIHWPKGLGPGARTLDAPIGSADFMPTLLGLCGISIPSAVEGIDFSGYLRGGSNPSDGTALISCVAPFGQWDRRKGGREYRGLRTTRYTYVRDLAGPWLLFDNRTDPFQQHNLVNDPVAAAVQAELETALARKLKASGDEFLPGAAYIRKWNYPVDANGTVPYTN